MKEFELTSERLLKPERLWSRAEILTRPCPIPSEPGIYAWYFRRIPPVVPIDRCHIFDGMPLLYVGISPSPPPANGGKPSQQNLRKRLKNNHYKGDAYSSTLRLTLGCILEKELSITLRIPGPFSRRMTFGSDGERKLSEWMGEHTRIACVACQNPWDVEEALIERLSLPLNLDQNGRHAFRATLRAIRSDARRRAREAV
jgi:hypothetical protein